MGIRNVVVSDISGEEVADDKKADVTIRSHPKLDSPKRLDANIDELKGLKGVNNLVTVEVRGPDGQTETIVCTLTDFEKVVPKAALANASSTRGRRRGFRPSSNGNGD